MCWQGTQQATGTATTSYLEIRGVYGNPSQQFLKFTNFWKLAGGWGRENGSNSLTVGPIDIPIAVLKTRLKNSSNSNTTRGDLRPPRSWIWTLNFNYEKNQNFFGDPRTSSGPKLPHAPPVPAIFFNSSSTQTRPQGRSVGMPTVRHG
jgi:hypothetical protein